MFCKSCKYFELIRRPGFVRSGVAACNKNNAIVVFASTIKLDNLHCIEKKTDAENIENDWEKIGESFCI